jgi:hypothetical protein
MQTVDNRSLVLFLSGLAPAGSAICIAVSCSDQPRPKCVAGRGSWAAVYTHQSGDMAGACFIPGEVIGVQAYNYPNADRTNADLNKGSFAVKGGGIAAAIDSHPDTPDMDPAHKASSWGDWATPEPGGDDFCNVPTFKEQSQVRVPFVPAVPPMPLPDGGTTDPVDSIDGIDIKYTWSNVKVLVKASANGTQLAGDLTLSTETFTDDGDGGTVEAGCTAQYKVRGLYNPNGIVCEKQVPDPASDAGGMMTVKDFCQCLPYPDPDNNRAFGSGFSSDLFAPQPPATAACELSQANADGLEMAAKVACQDMGGVHLCVLKSDPPQ